MKTLANTLIILLLIAISIVGFQFLWLWFAVIVTVECIHIGFLNLYPDKTKLYTKLIILGIAIFIERIYLIPDPWLYSHSLSVTYNYEHAKTDLFRHLVVGSVFYGVMFSIVYLFIL